MSKGLIKLFPDVFSMFVVDWFFSDSRVEVVISSGSEDLNSSKEGNSSDFTDAVDKGGTGLAVKGEGRLSSASGTVDRVISA